MARSHAVGGHLWKPEWDPEGLLSTLPAVASTLIGVVAGTWLRARRPEPVARELIVAGGLTLSPASSGTWAFRSTSRCGRAPTCCSPAARRWSCSARCTQALDDGRASPAALAITEPLVALGRNALLLFVLSGLVAKTMLLVTVSDGAGGRHSLQHAIYQTVFAPLASPMQRLAALCTDVPGAALRAAGVAAPAPLVLVSVDFQGYGETIGRRRRGRRVRRLECVAPGARRLAGDPGRCLRAGERAGEFIRSLAGDPRRLRRRRDLHPVGDRIAVRLALAGEDDGAAPGRGVRRAVPGRPRQPASR